MAGCRPAFGYNAIVFNSFPIGTRAFVLGNVIINPGSSLCVPAATYASAERARKGFAVIETVELGKHEAGHTWQYQILGPFFLPIYALSLFLPSPTPFEQAADIYAKHGSGWWPRMGRIGCLCARTTI